MTLVNKDGVPIEYGEVRNCTIGGVTLPSLPVDVQKIAQDFINSVAKSGGKIPVV